MLISLCALGVVLGAPLLVWLITLIGLGNLLSAIAPDFTVLAVSRVLSGLPHGV